MEIAQYVAPFIEKNGLSSLFLLIIVYSVWRSAKWIAPQVLAFAKSYIEIQEEKNAMLEHSISMTMDLQKETIQAVGELRKAVTTLTEFVKASCDRQ